MSAIEVDSEDLRRVLRLVIEEKAAQGIVAVSVMRLCSALPQSRHLVRDFPAHATVTRGHPQLRNGKIATIKTLVHHTGLGLKEARDWVEHLPREIDNADLARELKAIGCTVEDLGGST